MSISKVSPKPKCIAVTAKGDRCRNTALNGDYCNVHNNNQTNGDIPTEEVSLTPAQLTFLEKFKSILARLRLGLRLEVFGLLVALAGPAMPLNAI